MPLAIEFMGGPTIKVRDVEHAWTLVERWLNAPSQGRTYDICLLLYDGEAWVCQCRALDRFKLKRREEMQLKRASRELMLKRILTRG